MVPGVFPPGNPALKWAILSVYELAGLWLITVWFQSLRPFWVGARITLPVFALFAVPYLLMARSLQTSPGHAAALGAAILVATAITILIVWSGVGFFRVAPFAAIVALPIYLLLGVFVAAQVSLIWAAVAQSAAGPGILSALGSGLWATIKFGVPLGLLGVFVMSYASVEMGRTSFSTTVAQRHLIRAFKAAWRRAGLRAENGFPETIEELRWLGPESWVDADAPDGSSPGTYYDFRYAPGAADPDGRIRSFTMSIRKRSSRRSFTESYILDHLGTTHRGSQGWATLDDRMEHQPCSAFGTLLGSCDIYKEVHGAYPRRLVIRPYGEAVQPGEMNLPQNSYISARRVETSDEGAASIFEYNSGPPALVYHPDTSHGERPESYVLAHRAERDGPGRLRSYLADAGGIVYVTAEDRDATTADSVVAPETFARQRDEVRKWGMRLVQ